MVKLYPIHILTTLILCINIPAVNAQPPGYLGKRFIIGAETGALLSGLKPAANGDQYSIMLSKGFNAEYVTSRTMSIGFGVTFAKSGLRVYADDLDSYTDNPLADVETIDYSNYSTNKYDVKNSSSGKAFTVIRSKIYQFDFKWYRKRNVAPLGAFVKLSCFLQSSKIDGIDTRDINQYYVGFASSNSSYYGSSSNTSSSCPNFVNNGSVKGVTNLGGFLTVGKQHIFFDKLIINYGVKMGYTLGLLGDSEVAIFKTESTLKNKITNRNGLYNLISYQFGIGYLLF